MPRDLSAAAKGTRQQKGPASGWAGRGGGKKNGQAGGEGGRILTRKIPTSTIANWVKRRPAAPQTGLEGGQGVIERGHCGRERAGARVQEAVDSTVE